MTRDVTRAAAHSAVEPAAEGWRGWLRRLAGSSLWSAWILLAISLLVTVAVTLAARNYEAEKAQLQFDAVATRLNIRIAGRLRTYEQMLRSGAALFDYGGHVSREQWRSYCARLDLDRVFPGLQGIGFAEVLEPAEVASHVARIRAEGIADYAIHPAGDRPIYSPVVYLEPPDWRNQRAIGFDMMSEPVRRAAMERARDIGSAATSGKVVLIQETETDRQFGFLIYLPIYDGGGVPPTIEDRRARLRGYVYAPFRAGDLMTGVLRGESGNIRVQVFDGPREKPDNLLFDSRRGRDGAAPRPGTTLVRDDVLNLPERIWTTRIAALPAAHDEYYTHQHRIIALGGTIISGLLFLSAWAVTRSNDRLRRQEAQQRYLFEKNPSVMWVYDIETLEILEVNESAVALYGYSRDEFLGMKVTDLRPGADVTQFREFIQGLPDGLRRSGEWRHRTAEGRELIVDITSHTLRYAGRAASLVVARDVTDRRRAQAALAESEERFRSMANSMPAILWVGDPQGQTTFVNRYCVEFTGRTLEQGLGGDWLKLVHDEDRERVETTSRLARKAKQAYSNQYRLRRADGAYRWFIDRAVPRFDAAGDLVGYIGVLFDITEMREAQEQLQQAQKMESLGRLTGGIAHDFNNLLTVIEGSAEIIADDPSASAAQRKLARMIFTVAERGAELTRSMLALARRQPLEPAAIDVNVVVMGMETMLQRVLGEDIEIRFRRGDDLWPAMADANQLATAILNLVVNARDAMSGGGILTIETANSTLGDDAGRDADVPPGDYVMLAVSDTGTGMTPEVLEHAFDPYFTTKPVGSGTGLGLSIVFGFVKQSGGHVTAESEIGRGTTIRIHLPRAHGSDAAEPPSQASETPPVGLETVLVVEDDELVRSFVENQLRSLGYNVIGAADGNGALAVLAQDQRVDLLFTDVVMPGGMNGPDLADRARRARPGLKVLFMSGYAEETLTHQGRVGPGVHLLNKPFRRNELMAKVREVLDAPGPP